MLLMWIQDWPNDRKTYHNEENGSPEYEEIGVRGDLWLVGI